jgi:hypothetical protein
MSRTSGQIAMLDAVGNIGKSTYDYVENNNFIENNGANIGLLLASITLIVCTLNIIRFKDDCNYIYKHGNIFILEILFIILACAVIIYYIVGTIMKVDSKRLNINIIHISLTPVYILIFILILGTIAAV